MTMIEEFIQARLDDDERIARAATELPSVAPKYPAKRPAWEPEEWAVDEFGDVRTVNGASDPILTDSGSARSRQAADHIARHDPARVMQQVTALRDAVVSIRLQNIYPNGYDLDEVNFRADLRPIAAIWSDHLDYQREWSVA